VIYKITENNFLKIPHGKTGRAVNRETQKGMITSGRFIFKVDRVNAIVKLNILTLTTLT